MDAGQQQQQQQQQQQGGGDGGNPMTFAEAAILSAWQALGEAERVKFESVSADLTERQLTEWMRLESQLRSTPGFNALVPNQQAQVLAQHKARLQAQVLSTRSQMAAVELQSRQQKQRQQAQQQQQQQQHS